jgi:hypothetical protein
MRIPPVSILTVVLVAALGCATARVENPPLERYEPGGGYGANLIDTPYAKKLRVVLAFSGGGTRASALAYGVLKELRKTEISIDRRRLRLLDEVSLISSVSGGSFTSAYYGLHGERNFFNGVATTWNLDDETVDRLIEVEGASSATRRASSVSSKTPSRAALSALAVLARTRRSRS